MLVTVVTRFQTYGKAGDFLTSKISVYAQKLTISSHRLLWRVSATPPVADFEGKVTQCIKVARRQSPIASRRSLGQSRCVYAEILVH